MVWFLQPVLITTQRCHVLGHQSLLYLRSSGLFLLSGCHPWGQVSWWSHGRVLFVFNAVLPMLSFTWGVARSRFLAWDFPPVPPGFHRCCRGVCWSSACLSFIGICLSPASGKSCFVLTVLRFPKVCPDVGLFFFCSVCFWISGCRCV